jgi:DNA-binding transcriptional regulator YhcF (GntR family)
MKKTDDFFDKTREMADKAEAKLEETFEKVRTSETYAKITDAMGQAGEYVEKKIEELKESDIPEKAEKFREKAEDETEKFIGKAKTIGANLADDLDEAIDSLKDKLSGKDSNKNRNKTSSN